MPAGFRHQAGAGEAGMKFNHAMGDRPTLDGLAAADALDEAGIDATPTATAHAGVELKAIREAIARVEAEAKATVAAENRAHAEARARSLAEDRARTDAAAAAEAYRNTKAAEEALEASSARLDA